MTFPGSSILVALGKKCAPPSNGWRFGSCLSTSFAVMTSTSTPFSRLSFSSYLALKNDLLDSYKYKHPRL